MTDFREDGAAALEWTARYLERVGELPVLALLERVNATGEIFINHTKLDGRYVLRLAIGNARTTEADVRQAWDVLNREAER